MCAREHASDDAFEEAVWCSWLVVQLVVVLLVLLVLLQ
jgi:hypothetical protein